MKVVWSRRAIRHLVFIFDFISKHSEQNAAFAAKRILSSVALLREQPEMGRPGRRFGTRELVIPNTPFIIPYRIKKDSLQLLAVFHGSQKWPNKL